MCLRPLHVFSPAGNFSKNLSQRYSLQVACGTCHDCRRTRKDQWFARAYYHTKDIISSGGFIYFDTLTYRPSEVPHLSDFTDRVKKASLDDLTCFSRRDIRLFFVRLNRYLKAAGYNIEGKLTHFLASEYGSDDWYTDDYGRRRKAQSIPHYHVLFYVGPGCYKAVRRPFYSCYKSTAERYKGKLRIQGYGLEYVPLTPLELATFIDKSWQKGRTDGPMYRHVSVPGKRPYEFNFHVYSKEHNGEDAAVAAVNRYVTKYVLKNQSFEKKIKSKVFELYIKELSDDIVAEDHLKEYEELLRNVCNFVLVSKGFGLSFLRDSSFDLESIINDNAVMKVPDKDKGYRFVKMPSYYYRHLFYDKDKSLDGRDVYLLNKTGERFILKQFDRSVDHFQRMLHDDYLLFDDAQRQQFDYMLAGRQYKDFATYILGYRGRFLPCNYPPGNCSISDCDDLLSQVLIEPAKFHPDGFLFDTKFYGYNHNIYKKRFHIKFLCSVDIGNSRIGIDLNRFTDMYSHPGIPGRKDYLLFSSFPVQEKLLIDDTFFVDTVGFDALYKFYEKFLNKKNRNYSCTCEKKDIFASRYRDLFGSRSVPKVV